MPRFSVYIPVRNDAAWLPDAIRSVLAQTCEDWELVIGDNASEDDVAERIAEFDDRRITYRRFDELVPVAENWNRTMALARGEWLIALSADDRLRPACLASIARAIDEGAARGVAYAMVQTACQRVNELGQPTDIVGDIGNRMHPIHYQEIADGTYDGRAWMLVNAAPGIRPWMVGSQAVPRSLFVEVGGWRPEMGLHNDIEFALRIAAYGPIRYLDERLLDYTVREHSMTFALISDDLTRDDPVVGISRAWDSAFVAHAARRHIGRDERRAARKVVARSHLLRALQHRRSEVGHGRRGALRDVVLAARSDIGTVLEPYRLAAALAAVFAPVWLIAKATFVAHDRGWVMV